MWSSNIRFSDVESGAQLVLHALLCDATDGERCSDPLCTPEIAALKHALHCLEDHCHTCRISSFGGACAMCDQWMSLMRTREQHRRRRQRVQPALPVSATVLPASWALTLTVADVKKMTVHELKRALTDRGLGVSGQKASLIARLLEAIGSGPTVPPLAVEQREATAALPAASRPLPTDAAAPEAEAWPAEAEAWPAWLTATDDEVLKELMSVFEDEEAQRFHPRPVETSKHEPAAKRHRCTTLGTAAPQAVSQPCRPKATVPMPSLRESAPAPPCSTDGTPRHGHLAVGLERKRQDATDVTAVLCKLPPALFNHSEAMLEYRAAYRTYRMGAARGAAGEVPSIETNGSSKETTGCSRVSADVRGRERSNAPACLVQAVRLLPDFSKLVPTEYRKRYGMWRLGGWAGAKGESAAAVASKDELPRHVWVREVSSIVDVSWVQQVLA